ncbi:mercury resistance system substrate-binding protein MerP [Paenibacillus sp. 11B]|uniref:Mercury resistance system substrate-binding protein MerP n=1 Tax=Paenibacillus urinalis TaxID=521520 RepID=A0AAX3N6M2_9BACL|nr:MULTISPECIES: mercury resistance system substrate-binding protein MerP [Paenibacillus]MDN8593157.1 mercury resistance system substrate-binding protein MerP [Paenibacillus sp. 11B]WDH85262.1 mercury resistance system substrate-binding protein MerP [Paenibacillus urinalis]
MRATMGIMMLLTLLLLGTACGNNENTVEAAAAQSTPVANGSATFTVTGLDCCPPSVIQDLISKVDGVSKVDIEPMGSKGKVTVSFDDKKTDLKQIQTSVTKYGFGVIGG